MDAQLKAWYRGINPYPLLTMDESFYLLQSSSGVIHRDYDYDRAGELQLKAMGIKEQPKCKGCGETDNLTKVTATPLPSGTYHLCARCKREESEA